MTRAARTLEVAREVAEALIALKLYAGGRKSELDVLEVLACNPEADLSVIRELCERFRLGDEWRRIESLLGDPAP